MTQTPVIREKKVDELTLDFLATRNMVAGEVVLNGTIPMVVCRDIIFAQNPLGAVAAGAGEVWLMPQVAGVLVGGSVAYWNPTGNPVGGVAGSGAVTGTPTANPIGTVSPVQRNGTGATVATDVYVRVLPDVAKRAATIAGIVTADSITGSAPTLPILGMTATPTGTGGAVSVTGGTGGSTSGPGGATVIAGGAGLAGNSAGGSLTLRGGAGQGTGLAGAIAIGDVNTSTITLGRMPRIPTAVVTAVGTVQGDAAVVGEGFTLVINAAGPQGVVLPSAVPGMQCYIKNRDNAILRVYPNVADAINLLSVNLPVDLVARGALNLIASDVTTWYTFPLL
ncbi:MAG: hypothetical protein DDT37_01645 [Firmicutes bacterium]|nr:hypothetical protein [candidate division NPL-UPA2 bacterium]